MKSLVIFIFFAFAFSVNAAKLPNEFSNNGGSVDFNVPFQVSLHNTVTDKHLCSGVIITDEWILTSANCVKDFQPFEIDVHYSSNRLSGPFRIAEVKNIVIHHAYRTDSLENNIAMLSLESKLELNENASAIAIAKEAPNSFGEAAVTSGWNIKNVCSTIIILFQKKKN